MDANAYPYLAKSAAKTFKLRIGGPHSFSEVTFTVWPNGNAMVDDMAGRPIVEKVEQARERWAGMVKRGWRPA